MTHGRIFATALIGALAMTAGAAKPTPFTNQSRPMRTLVRILALSSASRQSFAGNQDVYLADIVLRGQHQFVKLVDQYPGFGLPIRPDLLRIQQMFSIRVTREPECDADGSAIFLRPGDASIFNSSVRDTLAHATEQIPCYKTLHQTIRLAGK